MNDTPAEVRQLLYPAFLGWATTIVRLRRHVLDHHDLDAIVRQRADRTLTTGTGTLHIYIHFLQTGIHSCLSGIGGSHLGCIRRILLGTLETHLTGTAPGDDLAIFVGKTNDDVVEAGNDVCVAIDIYFYDPFLRSGLRAGYLCFCHTLVR